MPTTITDLVALDIRFPTSRSLAGSDAMNANPDYSAAYVILKTDRPDGLEGHGMTFTIGRGNDICVFAEKALSHLVVGHRLESFTENMGAFWHHITSGDSELRWLGPEKGVIHLATAAIVNAVWDLYAKVEGKPLWELLADMSPEELVRCIDFRYITDALTPQEALAILKDKFPMRRERVQNIQRHGYPAYNSSVGWQGYSDDKMRHLCREALAQGWRNFKLKVGRNIQDDVRRAELIRSEIGYECKLMVDANQVWDTGEAIENIQQLAKSQPWWVEEPTSPDDVQGYTAIAKAIAPISLATGEQCQNRILNKKKVSMLNVPHHTSSVRAHSAQLPSEEDLLRAVEVLNAGKKVAILAGRGALKATDELEQLAEKLGAPIVKALLGKAAVPDHSPYTTGGVGLIGTKPSQDVMEECDTLLMVGTSFPYISFLPKPGQARGVQIDIDPMRIGLRYPVEVGLVGDSRRTLQALLQLLQRNEDRSFLEKAQSEMKDWWKLMEERGTRQDKPMKPQVVAWQLGKRLSDTAIVSGDSGTNTTWWARQIPAKRGQMHSVSGTMATMACGLPYTIAAQVAYPDRQCVAFVGDGGFSMLMAEFVTCVKYQLPVKIVIIKNNTLGQIKWEQMVFLGNPEYGCELQPIDFAAFARACGGTGFTIDDPAQCGEILDRALATPGPVIVDAIIDPLEPPMPAKISLSQAAKFTEALVRGEPNREKIVLTAVSDKVRELI